MTAVARSSTDIEAAIGTFLEPWHSPDTPGWAVAVVRAGEVVAQVSRGMASVEHHVPITPSTVFSMASISKQFVCASILLLEERGLVSLDDDVRTHVPEVPNYGDEVTLRHLMTNTSGLRDIEGLLDLAGFRFALPLSHDDILALIGRQTAPVCPPGEEYLYCNTGFRLLAVVVQRVTGQRWDEFMASEVLGRTGMTGSHVCSDRRALQLDLASAYDTRVNHYRRLDGLLPVYAVAESGESGLYSTLDDMTRWALAFQGVGPLAGIVGRLATPPLLTSGAQSSYGYGVYSIEWAGRPTVRHSGGMPGMHSEILHLPDEQVSVVCLANHEDLSPTLMARRVVASIVGDLEPEFVATLPQSLTGRFVDGATGIVIELGTHHDPAAVFDWGITFDEIGPGRLASFNRWLAMDLPPVGQDAGMPRSISLGGRSLDLRRVDPDAPPPQGIAGRYHSDELDADWVIAPAEGGDLRLTIEGPYGSVDRGRLAGAGPDLAIVLDPSPPWASLRIDRGSDGWGRSLAVATAAVRGVTLVRAG